MTTEVKEPTVYTKKATRSRVVSAITALNQVIVERDAEVLLIFATIIAGYNVLLFGPPGEGKSKMSRHILDAFDMKTYHNTLFASMDPDELIGGTILKDMVDGSSRRNLDKGLGMADLAFLDEVGKGPDSLMTTLMTILNERIINNDGEIVHLPLQSVIGATNEEDCQVEGLYDRFPMKMMIGAPSRAARKQISMMKLTEDRTRQRIVFNDQYRIPKDLLLAARVAAKTVDMSEQMVDVYHTLADGCETVCPVSTRKREFGIQLLKTYKWLISGADTQIDQTCLNITPHIFCDIPSQIPELRNTVKNFMNTQVSIDATFAK